MQNYVVIMSIEISVLLLALTVANCNIPTTRTHYCSLSLQNTITYFFAVLGTSLCYISIKYVKCALYNVYNVYYISIVSNRL